MSAVLKKAVKLNHSLTHDKFENYMYLYFGKANIASGSDFDVCQCYVDI